MSDESLHQRIVRARQAMCRAVGYPVRESTGSLEALAGADSPVLAAEPPMPQVQERVAETLGALHRIVDHYLEGEGRLHSLVDEIGQKGNRALNLLEAGEDRNLEHEPDALGGLEAIIRTDGSRPSFLIRDGEVDKASSPLGDWGDYLDVDANLLRRVMSCVGRIDNPTSPQGFSGTGFLIQEDLVLTNRHVLQAIADKGENNSWAFRPDITIDFGHEYHGIASLNRRALRQVVFCGAARIQDPVDHAKLDLALIELAPATAGTQPPMVLSVDASPDWPEGCPLVYTIGYPGSPSPWSYPPTLLEQLFQQTFGCKRLAPGQARKSERSHQAWTVAHDGTTLGGNSGSVIVIAGRPVVAAGLHYGGLNTEPAENWGHVLGGVLDHQVSAGGPTFGDILKAQGVALANRTIGTLP